MHCILATLFIRADGGAKAAPLSAFNGKMLLHSKWLNWLQLLQFKEGTSDGLLSNFKYK
jgi:hypothetical protein